MKRALIVQHLPFEDLGIYAPILKGKGYDLRFMSASIDDFDTFHVERYDLAVILGGPVSINQTKDYPWLQAEINWLAKRLANNAPTLGICLGAQAMALALGADVKPAVSEVGWEPITLTEDGIGSPLKHLKGIPVLHWHSDVCQVPNGARCLSSTTSTPNQAFCLGQYALGLQFHAEVQWPDLEHWLTAYAKGLADLQVPIGQFRTECRARSADLHKASTKMLLDWLSPLD